ncbi:MAG TPA: sugar phosphate isomerase/epimerase [Capsulimonadaceae bacterium]|nr:sugar phosphate isomerase/epimerase [Capsulimonadaceae bacterium]
MDIGILTAPLRDKTLEEIAAFAGQNGFGALEVACGPGSKTLDTSNVDGRRADEIRQILQTNKVRISSLAAYANNTPEKSEDREQAATNLKLAIDAAAKLGVDVVCTLAGLPYAGRNRYQVIETDAKTFFTPILDYAGERGIKIALENWFATNIMHLGHFEAIFQAVPHKNFGLNYDPSHLLWQEIDYIHGVDAFASRIFHTHAKDTEVNKHKRQWIGVNGDGWWRYVIPGFGDVAWGPYIAALRRNKYDGVLSIEHEDDTFGPEAGFLAAQRNLQLYL